MSKVKIHQSGMAELEQLVKKARVDYTEDIISIALDNLEEGSGRGRINYTGDLANSLVKAHGETESEFGFQAHHANTIEYGREPGIWEKLIEVDLQKKTIKELGRGLKTDKVSGRPIVPVYWDWARLKLGMTNEADRYRFCWRLYHKRYKYGKEGEFFVHKAVNMAKMQGMLDRHFSGKNFKVEMR